MKPSRAVNLAKDCINRRIRQIAWDANAHEKMGADYPLAKRSYKLKKDLYEAMEVLDEMLNPKQLSF